MTESSKLTFPIIEMIKDAFFSIVFIVGGNALRLRIGGILEEIHKVSPPEDSFLNWELALRWTSLITMWVGIAVGVLTLYKFFAGKYESYKANERNKKD